LGNGTRLTSDWGLEKVATFDDIRFVLVGITHPGNIGAAARAMKTMGLLQLALVNPKQFPCAEATVRAAGADEVLIQAWVGDNFTESLQGCHLVFGTSARRRSIAWPTLTPRECAEKIATTAGKVALVFGREHAGLTNEELDRCHYLVQIPTQTDFSSLNIAAAVQILAYEIFIQQQDNPSLKETHCPVSAEVMLGFYQHLEQTLVEIGFLDPQKPKRLTRRLQRLFNRAQPNNLEINILRGILTAVQTMEKLGKSDCE
jgi:TrmH family RNA methyltransferase